MWCIQPSMRGPPASRRSEEHTSELQSPDHLVCRLMLEKKKKHATSFLVCTSVNTGTPTRLRTSARISSPASMPQPRNDSLELRFALSYEALKMNGSASAAQMSFNAPAISSAICRDSMTHGPAIKKKGRSSPTSNPHKFIRDTSLKARAQAVDARVDVGARLLQSG